MQDSPRNNRTKRVIAFIVDDVLANSALALLGSVVPIAGTALAVTLYFTFQDSLLGPGVSPGRKLVGQQLAGESGEELTHARAAARNFVRLLLWASVVGLVLDVVLAATTGRLVADYIFDTRVWEVEELEDARYLLEGERELAQLR